jgi:hypothetical protein
MDFSHPYATWSLPQFTIHHMMEKEFFNFFYYLHQFSNAKKLFKHLGVKGEAHHQVSFSILGGGWTAHHTQEELAAFG